MPSLELASIDDFLGPRDSRFLGEGFKRVEHSLTDLTIASAAHGADGADGSNGVDGSNGAGGIEATAHLAIPGVWSRKGDRNQKPHLSSIDVMVFAARLTGLYAAHTYGLAPDARFEVRSIEMKAGSSPDEEGLAKVPVSGRLVAAETAGEQWSTTLDCRVGSLSARVRARHSPGRRPVDGPGAYYLEEELPGPWIDAPYGVPHATRRQLLTGVRVTGDDEDDRQASARVALVPDAAGGARDDASAGMIDTLVAVMQLGQVMLYTLDGVDRAHSNNLWMRRATLTLDDGVPAPPDGEVTARLEQARRLPSPAGTWRSAEVVGALHGVRIRVAVAHLLREPARHAGAGGGGR
ncbi:AvrD family protein [Streptomyces sp. NPDC006997]|uniref:AvrD family protein n=1 Tax=Streptomyces sp. NPDC006997 TaxID=3155356 RepID=UPI0033F01374